jgi:hypothetical protein
MAKQFGSNTSNSLLITIPSRGERDWDQDIERLCFLPISEHDHTGSGNGAQITTAALADGAVTSQKIANNGILGVNISSSNSNDADRAIDSDHIKDDAIISRHIANDAIDDSAMLDASLLSTGLAKSGSAIKVNIDNESIGTNPGGQLQVNVDDNTIEIDSIGNHIQVKAGGITPNELTSSLNTAINTAGNTSANNSTAITNLTNRVDTAESDIDANEVAIASLQTRDIDSLSDVDAATPTDGDILVYNSTSGNWETQAPSSGSSSSGSTEVLIAALLAYPNVQPNTWTDAIGTSPSNPGYFVKYESLGNFLDGTNKHITVPSAHNNSVYLLSIHASFYNSTDLNEIRVLLGGNVIYSTNNGSAARHIGISEHVFTVTTGQQLKIQLRHNGGIAISPDGTYCLKRII